MTDNICRCVCHVTQSHHCEHCHYEGQRNKLEAPRLPSWPELPLGEWVEQIHKQVANLNQIVCEMGARLELLEAKWGNPLRERVEKLESDCIKSLSSEAFAVLLKRIEELEIKEKHNEALVSTISANYVTASNMELLVGENVNNIFRHIDAIEQQVKHTQEGLELYFDKIDKLESNYLFNRDNRADLNSALSAIQKDYNDKISKLESYIKEYNDLVLGACPIQIDKWNLENLSRLDTIEKNDYNNRIKRLEHLINAQDTQTPAMIFKRLEKLEKDFESKLDVDYKKWLAYYSNDYPKKPHKCPVCEGTGGVKHPLTGWLAPASCHACEGKGIVWG